jgi:hypothetical protein
LGRNHQLGKTFVYENFHILQNSALCTKAINCWPRKHFSAFQYICTYAGECIKKLF